MMKDRASSITQIIYMIFLVTIIGYFVINGAKIGKISLPGVELVVDTPTSPTSRPPHQSPSDSPLYRLEPDTGLKLNEILISLNGRYRLVMQADGNLVLYTHDGAALWATNTVNSGAVQAYLQADGNFVLINGNGDPVWASGTASQDRHAIIQLQDDGNLVIYGSDGQPVWSTNTP